MDCGAVFTGEAMSEELRTNIGGIEMLNAPMGLLKLR
jgi:hypothetical protein